MRCSRTETNFDENRKIWSGPKEKQYYGPQMTIGEVVLCNLGRMPDKVIQVDDVTGEEMTAAELLNASKLIADSFMRRGLQIGDVVGICAKKTKYFASLMVASLLCGTPSNTLYYEFDKNTIVMLFEVTRPKIVFCDVENYNFVLEALTELDPEVHIIVLNGQMQGVQSIEDLLIENAADGDLEAFPCVMMHGDDTAVIVCSSGTTSTPKATLCSHTALLNLQVFNGLTSDSVLFTFSTMFWISGLWTLLASLMNGLRHVITHKPFTSPYFVDIVEKHRITDIIAGPQQIAQVLEVSDDSTAKRLTSLRTVVCGGSKVHRSISERMNAILNPQGHGLCVAYGMTELSGMLSANTRQHKREGSVGKLNPNLEVRIVSATGDPMGVQESGVVHIRSPFKWSGYFRNQEAARSCSTADGWLITTDIGHFDADGYLHIEARESDVFKSNNFHVHPEKIEEVIMRIPGVLEACVFGIPDFVFTNLIACAIVRSSCGEESQVTDSKVIAEVAKHFATYYHIKGGVFFVKALPKTATGKLQRRLVWECIQKTAQLADNKIDPSPPQ